MAPTDQQRSAAQPPPGLVVTTWTDFLCPWAYLGRRHTQWIRDQGVPVNIRAYELHPDIPREGRAIREGGTFDRLLDQLQAQSLEHGVAFAKPTRTPNTRKALELLELVHDVQPDRSLALDDALATAYWVDGRAIDEHDELVLLAADAGLAPEVVAMWERGDGGALLDTNRADAIELDVSATPSWRVGSLTISGIHHDEQFQRWVGRLIQRHKG